MLTSFVIKSQLDEHLLKECRKQKRHCQFSIQGCPFQVLLLLVIHTLAGNDVNSISFFIGKLRSVTTALHH